MSKTSPNPVAGQIHDRPWQYAKALHRYLFRRLRSREDAEDMAQEVYLRLLRVKSGELIESPQAYLYGIASHVVHQFRIRSGRERVAFDSEAVDELAEDSAHAVPDHFTTSVEIGQQLNWALNQLPLMQRVVLLLHKRDGLSDSEIASRLNVSVSTVKTHIARAQARIRTLWDDKGGKP